MCGWVGGGLLQCRFVVSGWERMGRRERRGRGRERCGRRARRGVDFLVLVVVVW